VRGLKDGYVVYYPKDPDTQEDAISEDTPVVLFLEGGGDSIHIDQYSGIMRYLASRGYFVIGGETGQGYDIKNYVHIFDSAIDTAIDAHDLTIKKLAVMGHSQGGGQTFYVMKHFQDKGYGDEVSLTLSVDGWFAFDMNQSDLRALQGDVRFLQMNGVEGTGTDPRIKLAIWNLADQTNRRFLTLPENNHMYIAGDINSTFDKKDLTGTIGALVDDAFERSSTGYCSLPDERKSSYEEIKNNLKEKSEYHVGDCVGNDYNATGELKGYDIDYCKYEDYRN
jgi:pimeloyl-ACP methyl ester carboxylesterase